MNNNHRALYQAPHSERTGCLEYGECRRESQMMRILGITRECLGGVKQEKRNSSQHFLYQHFVHELMVMSMMVAVRGMGRSG